MDMQGKSKAKATTLRIAALAATITVDDGGGAGYTDVRAVVP